MCLSVFVCLPLYLYHVSVPDWTYAPCRLSRVLVSVLPGVSGDLRPRGESLSPPAGLDQWWNDPSYISGPQEHLEGEVPHTGTFTRIPCYLTHIYIYIHTYTYSIFV